MLKKLTTLGIGLGVGYGLYKTISTVGKKKKCCNKKNRWNVPSITGEFGKELRETALKMIAPGKGLLAADESTGTIGKRFKMINVENTRENRRAYRKLLFTTKDLEKYISGVILYEETLFEKDGEKDLIDYLKEKGIICGIKVDLGKKHIPNTWNENGTVGLDDLASRCKKYYEKGARFAKWRAEIIIGKRGQPSIASIEQNCQSLAKYAAICQANGLVPIVEPEIMVLDGEHSIKVSYDITKYILSYTFHELVANGVELDKMILKPNMVLPGRSNDLGQALLAREIAEWTVMCLKASVPPLVPGIMFLSGGQVEDEAAENLSECNKVKMERPWVLSFSYGRALQKSCLEAWKGKEENVELAQKALMKKCENCSKASLGDY